MPHWLPSEAERKAYARTTIIAVRTTVVAIRAAIIGVWTVVRAAIIGVWTVVAVGAIPIAVGRVAIAISVWIAMSSPVATPYLLNHTGVRFTVVDGGCRGCS
jgi:ABC-type spermidine/putrescine transport system permease subunit II